MKALVIVTLASLTLAGCATTAAQSDSFSIDYRRLADCAYASLVKDIGPGLNKADMPTQGMSRITMESGGVRYWDVTISTAGNGLSRVEFTPVRNMWGSDSGAAAGIWPAIQACSSH